MTDRAQSALKAIGMTETPLASLEKDDALFALTAQTLLFQDDSGTRRVTLRDLTRIHSDQEGMLRVETPAGTALTASLLGFDAARVQAFFAQVRDTTARAKQQAAAAQPTSGEQTVPVTATSATATPSPVPVSPPPAMPVAPAPVAPHTQRPEPPKPEAQPEVRKTPPTIVIGDSEDDNADAGAPAVAPITRPVVSPAAVSPAPNTPAPSLTKPAPAPATPQPQTSQPVVISSSGFSPSSARPTVPYGSGTASPAASAPAAQSAATQSAATPAPKVAAPPAPVAAVPAPSASSIQPTAIKILPTRSASVSGLYAQADAVEALVSRLRILGVVLGVSAIALAFFLFRADQQLSGIWTLIAGGVGGISLLAVAELARLLVAIARATGSAGNPDSP
jgi:hypothetical protein